MRGRLVASALALLVAVALANLAPLVCVRCARERRELLRSSREALELIGQGRADAAAEALERGIAAADRGRGRR